MYSPKLEIVLTCMLANY